MSTLAISESPQLKLINEWYRALKQKDVGPIAKLLHKDHVRITYPRSLGKPEQSREEWLEEFGAGLSFMTDFEVRESHRMVRLRNSFLLLKAKTLLSPCARR
jgi:hypothetical protein